MSQPEFTLVVNEQNKNNWTKQIRGKHGGLVYSKSAGTLVRYVVLRSITLLHC
jgi:hypothetical protein